MYLDVRQHYIMFSALNQILDIHLGLVFQIFIQITLNRTTCVF